MKRVDCHQQDLDLDASEFTLRCEGDRIERVHLNAELV